MGIMNTVEKGFSRVNSTVFKGVNRAREWWELPTPMALLNLRAYRDDLRQFNLYDTEEGDGDGTGGASSVTTRDDLPKYRTYDGSLQDPTDPNMGRVGSRFGRNAPPEASV